MRSPFVRCHFLSSIVLRGFFWPHSFFVRCHFLFSTVSPAKCKDSQDCIATFSSGSLPPQKMSRISSLQLSHFHLGTCHHLGACHRKSAQRCSLQVSHSHLGACHRKNLKSRLRNRRWDRLDFSSHKGRFDKI